MEIFMNQGRDSTIEPAYLAEKKQVIPEPEPVLIEKTYETYIPYYGPEIISAASDNVDGYSTITLTGPSDVSTYAPVKITINTSNNTVSINSTAEQLTQAYQSGKENFYLNITYQEE